MLPVEIMHGRITWLCWRARPVPAVWSSTPGPPAGSPPAGFRRPGLRAPGRRQSAPALRPSISRKMFGGVVLCRPVMPGSPTASRSISGMTGSVMPRVGSFRPTYSMSAVIVRSSMLADPLASRSRVVCIVGTTGCAYHGAMA